MYASLGLNELRQTWTSLIQIALKFVPMCQIYYKPALLQVMACHQTGDKPLPEPMLTKVCDATWHH